MNNRELYRDVAQGRAQYRQYEELKSKVVLVTGAGSGIGRAMADAFAASGARLALLDVDAAALDRTSAELRVQFPAIDIVSHVASVADDAAVAAAVDAIHELYGRIDILLNNVGIAANQPSLDVTPAAWRRAIDINLNGVFYCAQAAGRHMVARGSGVILNTASMYGTVAAPERAAYCASKAAVVMLTKVLSVEWAPSGLRVNALAPGYVHTALVDELVRKGRVDLDALIGRTPARRLGQTEEIAALALFLASEQASFINGQAIVADGGWSAYSYI